MNMAKKEIDDFALDVKAHNRREAEAIAKPPADLFYSRLYPGQSFMIRGSRNRGQRIRVVRFDDTVLIACRVDIRDGSLSPEFRLSQSDFFATISSAPLL